MMKLPAFHKARLETFGFRFYSAKETKAFEFDLDDGEFLISHEAIHRWVANSRHEGNVPPVFEVTAYYGVGVLCISAHGMDWSAPIGSIPLLSVMMAEVYEEL